MTISSSIRLLIILPPTLARLLHPSVHVASQQKRETAITVFHTNGLQTIINGIPADIPVESIPLIHPLPTELKYIATSTI